MPPFSALAWVRRARTSLRAPAKAKTRALAWEQEGVSRARRATCAPAPGIPCAAGAAGRAGQGPMRARRPELIAARREALGAGGEALGRIARFSPAAGGLSERIRDLARSPLGFAGALAQELRPGAAASIPGANARLHLRQGRAWARGAPAWASWRSPGSLRRPEALSVSGLTFSATWVGPITATTPGSAAIWR